MLNTEQDESQDVFYKFCKLSFQQKEILGKMPSIEQFTLGAFLLLYEEKDIKELKGYIDDEKPFRGLFTLLQAATKIYIVK